MLSIEKCKKILVDEGETYTDAEIKIIREHLYKMAKITSQANQKDKDGAINKV